MEINRRADKNNINVSALTNSNIFNEFKKVKIDDKDKKKDALSKFIESRNKEIADLRSKLPSKENTQSRHKQVENPIRSNYSPFFIANIFLLLVLFILCAKTIMK